MGNIISSTRSIMWTKSIDAAPDAVEDDNEPSQRILSAEKAKEVEEFKKQLAEKREVRRSIIDEKRKEMQTLREQLVEERKLKEEALAENSVLRKVIAENNFTVPQNDEQCSDNVINNFENEIDDLKSQCRNLKIELGKANYALQTANSELALRSKENFELDNHIASLKEVNVVTKKMISLKDTQINQLKEKLLEIEKSLEDRETQTLSTNLKIEYEKQLNNIRNLRLLYEERARMAEVTRQNLVRDLENQKEISDSHVKKCEELEVRVGELEKELSEKNDVLGSKESQLGLSKAETRNLQAEMNVINKLFSQILLGYKNPHDLDKLLSKLEENHDLLIDMVNREDCNEISSALPKLILELANQVEKSNDETNDQTDETENDAEANASSSVNSPQEIVGNLPKVWRVLMELLSHQSGPIMNEETLSDKKSCYKSVETPMGPRLVPSVSKTYIRLKDLILEKNSLQKQMTHLKQLNSHLENRLQDQERRLGLVSSELSKTWHVVGRMQRQHQQIHTHEKILQYELQQKRVLLTHLKEELEFCKEKWDRAKQKNSESQIEWDKLRQEFADRKLKSNDSVNNSAESGYSDERPSDDESVASNEGKKVERKRYKKKSKSPEAILELKQTQERSDTFAIQEDDIGNKDLTVDDNLDSLSDNEEQGNLGDIEDQSEVIENVPETSPAKNISYDEVLAAKSARLKKLEEQCYVLVQKVNKTNSKSTEQCIRLEELHDQYGGNSDSSQPSTSGVQNSESECNNEEVVTAVEESVIPIPPPMPKTSFNEEYEARFAAREERLKRIEAQAKSLMKKVTDRSARSAKICSRLEQLHSTYGKSEDSNENNTEASPVSIDNELIASPSNSAVPSTMPAPKLSFVKEYEARFAARDERLKRMEDQAKNLVNQVTDTSTRGVEMCSKLEELHNTYGRNNVSSETEETPPPPPPPMPKISIADEYKARFAARDERLKRMEDQAKNLVNKVTDTTIRRTEICSKLEKLHDTYGKTDNTDDTRQENLEEPSTPESHNSTSEPSEN